MHEQQKIFLTKSREKAFDPEHRRKMNHSLRQSDLAFEKGKLQFSNLNAARNNANKRKWQTIENLDIWLKT